MINTNPENTISNIKVQLLPANSKELKNNLENISNILGVIEFSDGKFEILNNKFPKLNVTMKPFSGDKYYEVWSSNKEVSYGQVGDLKYSTDGFYQFSAVGMKEEDKDLSEMCMSAYDSIFEAIGITNYKHIARVWNYVPYINNHTNETERYKLFCYGRSESFKKNHDIYPAATGIGSFGDSLNIYMISTKNKNINIENPNQTPAYKYPSQYGIKPPSFARATYTGYGFSNVILYVSGTASILGHETVHVDDVVKQCETTINNIKTLISGSNLNNYRIQRDFTLKDMDCIKVYIKNEKDFEVVKDICNESFAGKSMVFLKADICRKDLLVEIEGMIID